MRKINAVVMTLAGLLLIVAAVLKAHEVFTVYFPSWREKGVWESWEFFLVQIPAEFALGVWMVSGLFRKAAWLTGTAAYFLFIGVTLHKALTGADSCGCFGRVEVDPWLTLFAIDIPLALLLAIFRPKGHKLLPPPWPSVHHAIVTAVPVFAALIFTAPLLVAFRPEFTKPEIWEPKTPVVRPINSPQPVEMTLPPSEPPAIQEPLPDLDSHVMPDVETVSEPDAPSEPEPKEVPNKPAAAPAPEQPGQTPAPAVQVPPQWPWLAYIDIADQLKEGIVIVYMYHYDCSTCAVSVPKYEAYNREMAAAASDAFTVAYLAIPPYSKDGSGPVPPDTLALHGKLTDQRQWAVTSPFVVALIDGSVVKQWPEGTAPDPDKILDEIFGQ